MPEGIIKVHFKTELPSLSTSKAFSALSARPKIWIDLPVNASVNARLALPSSFFPAKLFSLALSNIVSPSRKNLGVLMAMASCFCVTSSLVTDAVLKSLVWAKPIIL
ncbi:hypothetical protein D3C85_829260 [compost metagenome]